MLLTQNLLSLIFLGQLKLLPEEFAPSRRFYFCTEAKNNVRSELQNLKPELYNDEWIDRQFARLL